MTSEEQQLLDGLAKRQQRWLRSRWALLVLAIATSLLGLIVFFVASSAFQDAMVESPSELQPAATRADLYLANRFGFASLLGGGLGLFGAFLLLFVLSRWSGDAALLLIARMVGESRPEEVDPDQGKAV